MKKPDISKLSSHVDYIDNRTYLSYTYFGEYLHRHCHDYWEFVLVREGAYYHTLNGKTSVMERNDACLLRPLKDFHRLKNMSKHTCHYVICIPPEVVERFCAYAAPDLINRLYAKDELRFKISNTQHEQIMNYDSHLHLNIKGEVDLAFSFLLSYILEIVFSHNDFLSSHKPEWFTRLILQINSPDHINWQVQDVLNASNFSHTSLLRYFKQYENCTIATYLERTKMNRARDLLVYTTTNVLQIANLLGYSDSSHFNRAFKRTFGCSPSKYSKQIPPENKKVENHTFTMEDED